MEESKHEQIHSHFWHEKGEPKNPFVAEEYLCAGYDVFGDLLKNANWIDYLYLLVKHEQPTKEQSNYLNKVAIALANAGPKDQSIQAAMSAGVGGSTMASCLISALAVGAGNYGGARELYLAMHMWEVLGKNKDLWVSFLENKQWQSFKQTLHEDVWLPPEHPPGFLPFAQQTNIPNSQLLELISQNENSDYTSWLKDHHEELEISAQMPIGLIQSTAAAFTDLKFTPEQSEILFLLLRLPGAAAHALEQRKLGWRSYPFYKDGLNIVDTESHSDIESTRKDISNYETV